MTELEMLANEEARHGNREALERLDAELGYAGREAADRIEELEAQNAKLRNAIRDAYEVWAESYPRAKIQENDDDKIR